MVMMGGMPGHPASDNGETGMNKWARLGAAMVTLLVAGQGWAGGLTREQVDTIMRPAMMQGCTKKMETDAAAGNTKLAGAKDEINEYCGCSYDELTRGMSVESVVGMFMKVGEATQAGKPVPPEFLGKVATAGATCMQRLVVRPGSAMRSYLAQQCVIGFKSGSQPGQDSMLANGKSAESVCGCAVDKLLADGSPDNMQLLMRAGMSASGTGEITDDEQARLGMMFISCAAGDDAAK